MRFASVPTLLAVLALLACGGDEERATGARPESAAIPGTTPLPTVDGATLEAKTYTSRLFKPSITFTIPDGEWVLIGADSPDHIEIEPEATGATDVTALGFHHMKQVFDPAKGGEIPGDAVPGPEDFAKWLTEHPHLKATEPRPIEVMGLKGVSIDVRVKSSQSRQYRDCGKVEGDCVVIFVGKIEPIVQGSTSVTRFYVLEQPDGGQLVVEQFADPARALRREGRIYDKILETAKVAGAPPG